MTVKEKVLDEAIEEYFKKYPKSKWKGIDESAKGWNDALERLKEFINDGECSAKEILKNSKN